MIISLAVGIFKRISFLLAPPFCSYCKKFLNTRTILCSDCKMLIRPVITSKLALTRTYGIKIYALGAYQEPLQSLIRAKHAGDRIAAHELAQLCWELTNIQHIPCDYWIPVPLHWTRYAWRGFNQADEMAQIFFKYSNKPVAHILKRTRRTQFQAMLDPRARFGNVRQAFSLRAKKLERYHGKHLVLVDDLMTTGATLQEAAHVLRLLKPASITVVVAARVV